MGRIWRIQLTIEEAMVKVKTLMEKGWRFTFTAGPGGSWTCKAVGAGLAYAFSQAYSIEEAAEIAMQRALGMEDDPAVVIAKYEAWIRENVEEIFGSGSLLEIKVKPDEHHGGPHRIQAVVLSAPDADLFVRRDSAFQERLLRMPEELFSSLSLSPAFPDTAEARV